MTKFEFWLIFDLYNFPYLVMRKNLDLRHCTLLLLLQNSLHMSDFIWWYKLLSINLTRLPKAFLALAKKATHFGVNKESKGFVIIKPYIHQINRTLIITICKDNFFSSWRLSQVLKKRYFREWCITNYIKFKVATTENAQMVNHVVYIKKFFNWIDLMDSYSALNPNSPF